VSAGGEPKSLLGRGTIRSSSSRSLLHEPASAIPDALVFCSVTIWASSLVSALDVLHTVSAAQPGMNYRHDVINERSRVQRSFS